MGFCVVLFGKMSPQTGKHVTCTLIGGLSCPDACYRYRKQHGTGYAFILLCANFKYGKLTDASVTEKSINDVLFKETVHPKMRNVIHPHDIKICLTYSLKVSSKLFSIRQLMQKQTKLKAKYALNLGLFLTVFRLHTSHTHYIYGTFERYVVIKTT